MYSLFPILTLVALPLAGSIPNSLGDPIYKARHGLKNQVNFNNVAQFNFAPFEVTDLHILCKRSNAAANYSCALSFDWFDPNSVRENHVTSGNCRSYWSWDGVTRLNSSSGGTNPAVGYKSCWMDEETSFKVAITSFWHPGNFSLELVHRYRDDENFTKPWDHPTIFASADVCIGSEQHGNMIFHYKRGPVNGTVFGIVD